jgi:hypothetical protein
MDDLLVLRIFLYIEMYVRSTIIVNFATNVLDFFIASYN